VISVVIPTYRKPALLARTLQALVGQSAEVEGGCEIVVVDDGSQDDTELVLRRAAARLPLVVVRPADNEGRARARNRGWRAARGETVLFLDDDIVLQAGALQAHARAQARVAAAWLGEVVTAPEIIDSPLFAYLDSRGAAKLPAGSRLPARYFLTQHVSVPRAALERVGGFDEGFGAYGFEDMEVAFRMEDATGLAFYRLEAARGAHIHHHTLAQYLAKKRLCGRHSLRLMAARHPGRLREMQLDLLAGAGAPPRGSRHALRLALEASFRLRAPRLVEAGVGVAAAALPAPLRHRAYDYLVLAAYASGLADPVTDKVT
jgi:glycosyltransferase involved in cell wall biosynthesis